MQLREFSCGRSALRRRRLVGVCSNIVILPAPPFICPRGGAVDTATALDSFITREPLLQHWAPHQVRDGLWPV